MYRKECAGEPAAEGVQHNSQDVCHIHSRAAGPPASRPYGNDDVKEGHICTCETLPLLISQLGTGRARRSGESLLACV